MALKRALPPTHPGEILREDVLPALDLTVMEAAAKLGVTRQTLHRIVARRNPRPVTPDMAVRLGKLIGNGPRLWLNLQSAYDLGTPNAASTRGRFRRCTRWNEMTPDLKLEALQDKWLNLYSRLRKNKDLDHHRFAFPFFSVKPVGYNPENFHSVLYVGRATAGGWEQRWATKAGRRRETEDFMANTVVPGRGGSAFWRFAKTLTEIAASTGGVQPLPYQNFIWSNLAKIGTLSGNPDGKYFEVQRDLALRTLQAEISVYRAALIVFVTGGYQRNLVYETTLSETEWRKDDEESGYWWHPATQRLPALLWTDHPQGKPLGKLTVWADKARKLLERT